MGVNKRFVDASVFVDLIESDLIEMYVSGWTGSLDEAIAHAINSRIVKGGSLLEDLWRNNEEALIKYWLFPDLRPGDPGTKGHMLESLFEYVFSNLDIVSILSAGFLDGKMKFTVLVKEDEVSILKRSNR